MKIYVKPLRIFPTLMSPIMYRSLVGVAKAKAGSAWRQKVNELNISKLIAEATKTVSKEIKFRDTDDNFRCAENYIKDWLKRYAV